MYPYIGPMGLNLPSVIAIAVVSSVIFGALWGLLPFFLGRSKGRPDLGNLGLILSAVGGLLFVGFFVAIGFTIAICCAGPRAPVYPARTTVGGVPPQASPVAQGLQIQCLSGPLRGQTYPIPMDGVMLGRDASCAIRLPDGTPGISSRHCVIRWRDGVPVLEDMGSTYGTFLGDGSRLPPNYPTQLAAGSRFYLGNTSCLFQISMA